MMFIAACNATPIRHEKGEVLNPFEPVYVSEDIISCIMKTSRIEYVQDPIGKDYWQTPVETQRRGKGDCEDLAIYARALLVKRGIDAVVVVGARTNMARFGHSWVEFSSDNTRYVLEPKAELIMKRSNLPENWYIPANGVELANRKFKDYYDRTGIWLNKRLKSE